MLGWTTSGASSHLPVGKSKRLNQRRSRIVSKLLRLDGAKVQVLQKTVANCESVISLVGSG